MHTRTRACNVQARTLLSVWPWPMQKASVAHARTVHWPQLPRHILCAAATPHPSLQSSVGLQLEQFAVNCNAAEKALLADVTEAHPDASYIELLRLFKVRSRRWALVARMLHRACRALPAHICSQLPRLTLCSVLRWLLVCLFACLFVCLRLAFAKHTVDGAAYAARASSRGDGLFAACCVGVRCACTGALPPNPPSRCRTSALHRCVCVEYPRRGKYCAIIESSPRTSRHADRPCCM
jgi:hypothetical protein